MKKMFDAGVNQESQSDWASSPVLIRKRDGSVRWCIDYRALNNVTVKDTFPLPLIEDCLDTLSGSIWFSKLLVDANSAYFQVRVSPEDRKKTAFITKYGLFEHVRMGFGMTNSPATFSRVVDLVLRGLTWKTVLAFLDDILVMGKTIDEHLQNLATTLERFQKHKLKLKPRKCSLFQKEVEFLGRIVTGNHIKMAEKDVQTVSSWPTPTSSKDVERFLGLANYHRTFVKDFAALAKPLYGLTGKNMFKWGNEEETAFQALKQSLVEPPVLAIPNNKDPFILDTDASDQAIGAELIQVQDGVEKVIAYSSYTLTPEQRNYCTTRKELLSIVRFTRQFRHYLLGKVFTVRTDHSSLTWLLKFKDPQGQLARWMEELALYHMVVQHRAGSKHGNADALSRIPEELSPCPSYVAGIQLSDLPCGGCRYCKRAEEQWGTFHKEVDEAIDIAAKAKVASVQSLMFEKTLGEEANRVGHIETHADDESLVNLRMGRSDSHFDIIREDGTFSICTCSQSVQTEPVQTSTCWGFTIEELSAEQSKDPDLQFILSWLRSKTEPEEGQLFLASKAAKSYWLNKDLFVLLKGVLYRRKDGSELDLVVPISLRTQAMEWHHDIPSAGHQGVSRTKTKMKEKFYWYGMSTDIESYVLSCAACSQNKKNKRNTKLERPWSESTLISLVLFQSRLEVMNTA